MLTNYVIYYIMYYFRFQKQICQQTIENCGYHCVGARFGFASVHLMHANNSSMPQQWVLLPLYAHTVTDIICWNTACVASPVASALRSTWWNERKRLFYERSERLARARFHPIPALSPRFFLSPAVAFNGLGDLENGEGKGEGRATTSCQEEERTCKITRRSLGDHANCGAHTARTRSRYAPPPAVVCLWCALSSTSRHREM